MQKSFIMDRSYTFFWQICQLDTFLQQNLFLKKCLMTIVTTLGFFLSWTGVMWSFKNFFNKVGNSLLFHYHIGCTMVKNVCISFLYYSLYYILSSWTEKSLLFIWNKFRSPVTCFWEGSKVLLCSFLETIQTFSLLLWKKLGTDQFQNRPGFLIGLNSFSITAYWFCLYGGVR